ncbi:MAG: hypothetical protein ABEK84_06195 [Salinibacter sp.]
MRRDVAVTVEMQTRTEQAKVDCAEAPRSVSLDPDTQLLAELSITRAE